MGVDRALWGTDSVWYGSRQWQIEAMRRLEMPEDLQEEFGFTPLDSASDRLKNQIFSANTRQIDSFDTSGVGTDRLAIMKLLSRIEPPCRQNFFVVNALGLAFLSPATMVDVYCIQVQR